PERGEDRQDRLEVRAEARDLLAVQVRLLEEALPVCSRPDRLHDVSEVEPTCVERPVSEDRERRELCGERRHRYPDENLGRRECDPHATPSSTSLHRRPRTSSLACWR